MQITPIPPTTSAVEHEAATVMEFVARREPYSASNVRPTSAAWDGSWGLISMDDRDSMATAVRP